MLKKLVLIILLFKITIFLVIFLGYIFLPFNGYCYRANFTYPAGEEIGLGTAFKTWDAQHYLFLAEKGYSPDQMSNAFSPLYPFLIKMFRPLLFNNSLAAGLALSNLFSMIATIFFYVFVRDQLKLPDTAAFNSSLLLLAFPTGSFFPVFPPKGILRAAIRSLIFLTH